MNKDFWSKGLTPFLFCAHSVIEDFFTFILWFWLADSDMSGLHSANHWSFLRFSSVPRHSCHICHLQPPTGKALFRTDIGTFWRSYQYCSESAARLHCNSICNFNWSHQRHHKHSARAGCCCSHPKLNGHLSVLSVGVTLTFVLTYYLGI